MKNYLGAFLVALPLTVLLSGCPLYIGDSDGPDHAGVQGRHGV